MSRDELQSEFNRKIGEILRAALAVEAQLDYFIADYFLTPGGLQKNSVIDFEKRVSFQEIVLSSLKFEEKKKLFVRICKKEKCDSIKLKTTSKSIDFIQRNRNNVAHWHMGPLGKENELFLTKRFDTPRELDKLRLNQDLMNEVGSARLQITKGITSLQLELYTKKLTFH